MQHLYPSIQPYAHYYINVDNYHHLYTEEVGNPFGIPALFVHGGPGAGCSEDDRRYFDPNEYRIILFDQRGCGRSIPHADSNYNTTQDLINDIEHIRQYLEIEQWLVVGGSWGSTLSLAYAQSHPERVAGLILRSIFLSRQRDIDWLFQGYGANRVFPEYWQAFLHILNPSEIHQPLASYYQRLTSGDEVARMQAAKAWSAWEAACSSLYPNEHVMEKLTNPHTALSLAKLECYYFMHQCFLRENQLLEHIDRIRDIPGILIHGRYDMVTLLDNAWTLSQTWPQAELHIIREAGHAASEPGITDALIRATQSMAHYKLN